MGLLKDICVVCAAINVPGPAAAARLGRLGARVIKVEPPAGDMLAHACPAWYAELTQNMEVKTLNLKQSGERAVFHALLEAADVLITSNRPGALERLGLDWESLHGRHERLCHVAIVGYPSPNDDQAGHDLTYEAANGLIAPPEMPRTLVADLAGAEQAASVALALLLERERSDEAGFQVVALSEAAADFAAPMRHGVTAPGGFLGGGLPNYRLYRASDGWLAVAALEDHFFERLRAALGIERAETEDLEHIFAARAAADWEQWALERDLPIAAVRG